VRFAIVFRLTAFPVIQCWESHAHREITFARGLRSRWRAFEVPLRKNSIAGVIVASGGA
jgi:hypothetical protein